MKATQLPDEIYSGRAMVRNVPTPCDRMASVRGCGGWGLFLQARRDRALMQCFGIKHRVFFSKGGRLVHHCPSRFAYEACANPAHHRLQPEKREAWPW